MTTNSSKKPDWKKFCVFVAMALLFAGAMYMIFKPSAKTKEEQNLASGLNMEIPEPSENELVDDKRTAYEQERMHRLQQERMRTLADFTGIADVENVLDANLDEPEIDETPVIVEPARTTTAQRTSSGGSSGGRSSTQTSLDAHRDMNRSLGAFYEQPREDPRVLQLQAEVEILKSQLESQPQGVSIDDQLVMMEKSYEMAARFMPQMQQPAVQMSNTPSVPLETGIAEQSIRSVSGQTGNSAVVPITNVNRQVVSALSQQMSDVEFVEAFSRERNLGFFSAHSSDNTVNRNTIRACIHDNQTVSEGIETQRNVRIRLTEPMMADGVVIPANTIITGQARIGERLDVVITSIEYQGRIYATEISVYDVDGQRGIAIPPAMEVNALREIGANAGSSMGTSITFSQSAGEQIAADVGRGVIQGTSQYISRKMRVVKVHLKAGHQVFLLPKENL